MTTQAHAIPGMAVVMSIALAGLCVACIGKRTRLSAAQVEYELSEINAARRRRERPPIGPFDVHCQGCEAPAQVYRLR